MHSFRDSFQLAVLAFLFYPFFFLPTRSRSLISNSYAWPIFSFYIIIPNFIPPFSLFTIPLKSIFILLFLCIVFIYSSSYLILVFPISTSSKFSFFSILYNTHLHYETCIYHLSFNFRIVFKSFYIFDWISNSQFDNVIKITENILRTCAILSV